MNEFDLSRLDEYRGVWRAEADRRRPVLQHKTEMPKALCRLAKAEDRCQGVDAVPICDASELPGMSWEKGGRFILDFGEHHVGYFTFDMHIVGNYCDSPISLRILAAELPYELEYEASKFHGLLSQAWIQEEYFKIDEVPESVRLPRRYACRYLLVEVLAAPGKLVFDGISFDTVSSENYLVQPPGGLSKEDAAIWTAGCRTLRDCMQLSLEDGPKRDRRLWLGDLFLEAKTNAVTYRNWGIIEHCVYLLAANSKDNGMIAACAFENPKLANLCFLPDYAMIFTALLREHSERAGYALAEEFYGLALHQLRLCRRLFDDNARIIPSDDYWFFIDHAPALDKNTPEACVLLYSLKSMAALSEHFGQDDDLEWCRREYDGISAVLRKNCWDEANGVLVSGESRQVSEASQAWAVLAGLLSPEEGRRALEFARNDAASVKAHTPFLKHFILEAMCACGERDAALEIMRGYWGRMLELGADTFWEAFRAADGHIALYEDAFLSSACHAWSCTPCVFLAK